MAAVASAADQARSTGSAALRGRVVTLEALEGLALLRDPDLAEQLAAYGASLALTDVDTPLQDPTFSFGANAAVGPGVTQRRVGFPALSASLPLPFTGRRARQDTRDAALVDLERARVERAARLAVLGVRSLYVQAAMAVERLRARAEIAEFARELARSAQALVDTGGATVLDLALLRLETTRAEQSVFNADVEARAARALLAEALLMEPSAFDDAQFDLDVESWLGAAGLGLGEGATLDLARSLRTDLTALEAEYAAAEAELALQIARQWQDLRIGTSIAPEPAEAWTIVGLALSGALPLLQRNAQQVASALGARAQVRARYGVLQGRVGAAVAAGLAAVTRAEDRARFVSQELLPAAQAVTDAAELGVGAGTASALALLSATRSRIETEFGRVTARQDIVRAWLALERACEAPLLGVGTHLPPEALEGDIGDTLAGWSVWTLREGEGD